MADLKTEQQITEELTKQRALANDGRQSDATRQQRAERIAELEKELSSILSDQVKAKKIYNKIASDANKIEKDTSTSIISRLQSLAKGNLQAIFSNKAAEKQQSLQSKINIEAKSQADVLKDKLSKDKLSAAAYGQTLSLVEKIKSGEVEREDITSQIANINQDGQDIAKGLQNDFERLADIKSDEGEKAKEAKEQNEKQAKIVATLGVGFATLLSLATKFGSAIDKIGQTFGSLNVLGKEVTDNLLDSSIEATKLGGSIDDVASITNTLASNFGISLKEASALSAQVFDTSKAIGLSADEGANLFGVLMQTADLSADQAEQLAEGAFQLARQAGVAPSAVLKDIAGSSEVIATFTKDGGENIAQAAVQARQLGVSLNDTAKIAEGLLDFENSITKEVEASVLIGRQINLQKAREAALNNDIAGAMEEVVKQLGSEEEFNKLNAIQRKALADSIGVGTNELAKFVGQQDKLTLSAALTTKAFEGVSGQEALSQISQLTNTFASLGVTLTNALGPALMFVAKTLQLVLSPIAAIMSGLNEMNAIMPVLTAGALGYAAGLAYQKVATMQLTKAKLLNIKATVMERIANAGGIKSVLGLAAAKFFGGAASGSGATLGFGTPALVAMAAAAVALMYGMVKGFNKGGMIGRDGGAIASSDTVPIMGTPGEIILNEAQQANVVSTMQSKPIVERQVIPQPQIAQNFGTQNAMQNSFGFTKEDLKSVFSEVTIPITGEFKQGTVKMANDRDLGSISQTSTVPV